MRRPPSTKLPHPGQALPVDRTTLARSTERIAVAGVTPSFLSIGGELCTPFGCISVDINL